MIKRTIQLLVLFSSVSLILFYSCQEDIVVKKLCTEEPDLPFSKVFLSITVDSVTTLDTINVDNKGFIYADNVRIISSTRSKNAKIGGYICNEPNFYVDVKYNDTLDNSRLRMEGRWAANAVNIDIYYCLNLNNSCTFVKIGQGFGSIAGYRGFVMFNTPLYTGLVDYWVN